jgi:hypothetical protein
LSVIFSAAIMTGKSQRDGKSAQPLR